MTVTCPVLKLARRRYYRWLRHSVTDADVVQAYRANALFDAYRHDLVQRDFTATAPNRLWLTDITEHPTGEGKVERTYHRRRRQARLGRLTPIEYEAAMTTQVALAA